ncbi:hypothetical protein QBC40DRAFT_31924 [Triangularia verruculosa]|uniref:Uncharacterized protein n=1 Tax=Triangularia verruculosa TaxID=2587418 RepID=A0AAN7AXC4_9PEZI|nr:hypothetical protein QBC40DRAFT_31924 [Triangularia verruculosa]
MDSRLENTFRILTRRDMKHLGAGISRVWNGAVAFCSNILSPKAGRGKHTNWLRRPDVWVKIIMSVIGLTLTCTGVWAAVASVVEAKTANELARWTSTKDFMEFCESHNFNASNCMSARNKTLPPPPGFSLLRWRSLSIHLWGSNSTPDSKQHTEFDIASMLPLVLMAICLCLAIRSSQRRRTYKHFHTICHRTLGWLSKTGFWPINHTASLPLTNPTIQFPESSDLVIQEMAARHRKPSARRRREARLDRFSRYRTAESNHTADDDTSSDELYTHGEDTRRSRLRLRRRTKRVVNDENV